MTDIARNMPLYDELRDRLSLATKEVGAALDEAIQKRKTLAHTGGKRFKVEAIAARVRKVEAIMTNVREMEDEAKKLKEMKMEVAKQWSRGPATTAAAPSGGAHFPTPEEKMEVDARSVYIGNVDYGATAEELGQHFKGCGSVNRVTILCDKFTGHPKGFAYVEFAEKDSVDISMALDGCSFRGRELKVNPKRTNRYGISSTNRGHARGRGGCPGGRGGPVVPGGRGGRGGRGGGFAATASYGGGVAAASASYGGGFAASYGGGFAPYAKRGYGRSRGRGNYYNPY